MPQSTRRATERTAELLPDTSVWQSSQLRLTVFPTLDPKMSSQGWWEGVVGAAPEFRSAQPRQNIVQESGAFLNGTLTLNVSPLRIDWILTPSADQEPPEKLPSAGEFPKAVEAYGHVLSKWLASAPRMKRVAFGAVLLQEVGSHEEGYLLIDKYLPSVELDPKSSDFSYQINRPRKSNVASSVTINRLSKWSVARLQSVQLQFQGGKDATTLISGVAPTQALFACRLELDMSTEAMRTEAFDSGSPQAIFGELIGLAMEIAAKGDVP